MYEKALIEYDNTYIPQQYTRDEKVKHFLNGFIYDWGSDFVRDWCYFYFHDDGTILVYD